MPGSVVELDKVVLSQAASELLAIFVEELRKRFALSGGGMNLPPTKARTEDGKLIVFVDATYPSGTSVTFELPIAPAEWRRKEGEH